MGVLVSASAPNSVDTLTGLLTTQISTAYVLYTNMIFLPLIILAHRIVGLMFPGAIDCPLSFNFKMEMKMELNGLHLILTIGR